MNKSIILIIFILSVENLFSQICKNTYFIEFKDKGENTQLISTPEKFLSKRAIERRLRYNIPININDIPVYQNYVLEIQKLGFKILLKSKWFNGITVYTEDSVLIESAKSLPFVKEIPLFVSVKKEKIDSLQLLKYQNVIEKNVHRQEVKNKYEYGKSLSQIELNNGNYLHNLGYCGQNMLIAVTDVGFVKADELSAFKTMFKEKRFVGAYNFVNNTDSVFKDGSHGTSCLSIICADVKDQLIGSAPKANFALLVSETGKYELPIEEFNWISAVEFADSIGADVISTSLGYFSYDDSTYNRLYTDLDGKTALASRAASIAAQKGIIVCVAAGNSGASKKPWISIPSDADSILTVAAVTKDKKTAYFTSIGFTSDNRVKPDVAAVGFLTIYQSTNGKFVQGNGTSLATPIIAGLTACLWQKYPSKTNSEIMDAIRQSADCCNNPNIYTGYGIADFEKADQILKTQLPSFIKIIHSSDNTKTSTVIFSKNNIQFSYQVVNSKNKVVLKSKKFTTSSELSKFEINLNKKTPDNYTIKLFINGEEYCFSYSTLL